MRTKIYLTEKIISDSQITQPVKSNSLRKKLLMVLMFFTISNFSYSHVYIDLTIFIQGYYIGNGEMNPSVYNQMCTGSATAADAIRIELWCSTASEMVAAYNGTLNIFGKMVAMFGCVPGDDYYYIVVKHRNALETWSNLVYLPDCEFCQNATPFSFSVPGNVYEENVYDFQDGNYGIYSGDIPYYGGQDGYIDNSDETLVYNDAYLAGITPCDPLLTLANYITDLNGDGYVDTGDETIVDNNTLFGVYLKRPDPSGSCSCGGCTCRLASQGNTSFVDATLKTFPSPANNNVKLESSESFGENAVMSVYNSLGEKVKSVQLPYGENDFEFSVTDLSAGFYQCTIQNNETVLAKTRIVVSK